MEILGFDWINVKIIAVILSFLLGLFSKLIFDYFKWRRDKLNLIEILKQDYNANWKKLDELKGVPEGEIFVRIRGVFKGVTDLSFHTLPEYKYRVWNLKIFDVEGIKLVRYLKIKQRKLYWQLYGLLNDLEQTRIILEKMQKIDDDYSQYQKLFKGLLLITIEKYDDFIKEIT